MKYMLFYVFFIFALTLSAQHISLDFRDTEPLLDGNVLNDPFWQDIEFYSRFYQHEPDYLMSPSEITKLAIQYTKDSIFIAIICDHKNAPISSASGKRDQRSKNSDLILIALDTFNDNNNGFFFGTNPNNAFIDGVIQKNEDSYDWDGLWDVKVKRTDTYWSAEFKIPFSTLSYQVESSQTWGINIRRYIHSKNEKIYMTKVPQHKRLRHLRYAMDVGPLSIPKQRHITFMPYFKTEMINDQNRSLHTLGGDVLYRIGNSSKAIFTANTDFAQAEIDDVNVQLDQYSILLDEKRDFFLENTELFSIDDAYSGTNKVFHSRTIGLSDNGEPIPILGGVKWVTNTLGYDFGLLNIITDKFNIDVPEMNYSVLRFRKKFGSSFWGFMTTHLDNLHVKDNFNPGTTVSSDFLYKLNDQLQFNGFIATSLNEKLSKDSFSYYFRSALNRKNSFIAANYVQIDDQYNPSMGYVRETNIKKFFLYSKYIYRKPTFYLYRLEPDFFYNTTWTYEGVLKQQRVNAGVTFIFNNYTEIELKQHVHQINLTDDIDVNNTTINKGNYKGLKHSLRYQTNTSKRFYYSLSYLYGDYYNGTIQAKDFELTWKLLESFKLKGSISQDLTQLPTGGFDVTLASFDSEIVINNKYSSNFKFQLNSYSDTLNGQFKLSYFPDTKQAGFFIMNVYNNSETDESELSFILKYTYSFATSL
ncbi:hypothetical protein DID76_00425 [Candidatus Marinamargulisbacteria bacterium SCGC AG-414-C22]|nr:hypothetical protein DID76_00425 [Candidatus Marinamargulisbacteria bacterium SCGC AG-414-C22]